MRRLILFNMVTLDGYFAGAGGDLSWHRTDDEFNDFAAEQLDCADTLVFGRRTYEMMAAYWPAGPAGDPVTPRMNALNKVIFSKTLRTPCWGPARVLGEDAVAEMWLLKAQPGRDLLLVGSANLAATFDCAGLIDEYRLMVNPVLLRTGQPMFRAAGRRDLRLAGVRQFANGNVLLRYLSGTSL